VFICYGLSNDAVNNLVFLAPNDCMIVMMNWEGRGRKWSWLNLKYYTEICWTG
jgi:hypothetical protein